MNRLFPEITSLRDVMRLARGGAIAGIVFAGILFLEGLLGTASVFPASFQLATTGLETSLILVLAWRVWSGRGLVSSILLMALLVLATMRGLHDGAFGLSWMAAYFGLGLMMLNAIRASLRHDVYSDEAADAQAA